jgi:hypothetical protein
VLHSFDPLHRHASFIDKYNNSRKYRGCTVVVL